MRSPFLLGVAIAVATFSGACSGAAAPSPAALSLDGRTFLSTAIEGKLLVPGTRVSLSFNDGSLQANGGCNSMGGAYTIVGDRLVTTQLFMTEMACAEPRMQQDEWLARFIGGATIALAGDTLTLDDDSVQLTLLDREVATPDLPLEGTRWQLDGIVSGEAVSSVPPGVTASILILDGNLEIATGCNTGGGAIQVDAEALTFGPIALTKMACEPGAMAVEAAVVGTLVGTLGYAIDADVLTMSGGASGLILRGAP